MRPSFSVDIATRGRTVPQGLSGRPALSIDNRKWAKTRGETSVSGGCGCTLFLTRDGKTAGRFLHGWTGRERKGGKRVNRMLSLLASGDLLLAVAVVPAFAEERTIVGTIVRLDAADRTLTVQDGKGAMWNYKVDGDA